MSKKEGFFMDSSFSKRKTKTLLFDFDSRLGFSRGTFEKNSSSFSSKAQQKKKNNNNNNNHNIFAHFRR